MGVWVAVGVIALGIILSGGEAWAQETALKLMTLRVTTFQENPRQVTHGPDSIASMILGEGRGTQPHLVGLRGVRDSAWVEGLIGSLNRSLAPEQSTYVTWLTGGGTAGNHLAILSLFPLSWFEDLSLRPEGPKVLYGVLDARGRAIHALVVGSEASRQGKDYRERIPGELWVGRLVDRILLREPEAWVVIMGDLDPDRLMVRAGRSDSLRCLIRGKGRNVEAGSILVGLREEILVREDGTASPPMGAHGAWVSISLR